MRYPSQRLIGFNKLGPAPLLYVYLYLLCDPLDSLAAFIGQLNILLQCNLLG
jgi:hypothetical protein